MITEPTLLLDEDRCRRNIANMANKFARQGVTFRPHFKTHQSVEIGEWFKEYGVDRITVSSLRMAEYFAGHWDDITVAFPANILEIERINNLASRIQLNLLVESTETTLFLAKEVRHEIGIFLKIDVGYQRTGLAAEDRSKIDDILFVLSTAELLHFRGFLAHAGHTYACRGGKGISIIHQSAKQTLQQLKSVYRKAYPDCILSLGDTPSCSVAEDFIGLDEVRPGNFVFYDLTQNAIGSNTLDDIAVALACPIVAIHPERNEIIVYGGGVHFSKDRLEDQELGTIYGKVVRHNGLHWSAPIPGMYIRKLSQEHGTVFAPSAEIAECNVGDYLVVLPVHSCMAANVMGVYRNVSTNKAVKRL